MLSLEFAARSFLLKVKCELFPQWSHLEALTVGQRVRKNSFTSSKGLRSIIQQYNREVRAFDSGLRVDEELAHLRNALAHGRVSSRDPSLRPLHLLNFDKSREKAKVAYSVTMTKEWFDEQIKRVKKESEKVARALDLLDARRSV